MSELEAPLRSRLPDLPGLLSGAESARAALTAIATSSLTIAALAVSLTLAVLTHAGAQYSPRVLKTFMRDPTSQASIGLLLAVHAYSLVVMRNLDAAAGAPQYAASLGVLAGFVSVAMLIYYLHHVASSLRASHVVAAIADETEALLNAQQEQTERSVQRQQLRWPSSDDEAQDIAAAATGYLASVDLDVLDEVAHAAGAFIRVERSLGGFVMQGEPLAKVWPPQAAAALRAKILDALPLGDHPECDQDAYSGIGQLVDLALRALSPGLNDPHSACLAIDRLGVLLCRQARIDRRLRDAPPGEGRHGRVVLQRRQVTDLVRLSFDPLRQAAGGQSVAFHRLMQAIERLLLEAEGDQPLITLLSEQLDAVGEAINSQIRSPYDRAPQLASLRALNIQVQRMADPATRRTSAAGPAAPT